jgi:tRNA(Leu) C34 or U34 (ribose-2'-O)-methylase TrmL
MQPIVRRGFSCVGLDNPKTDINVGSVLRAAGVFECDMVAISGHRYRRAPTDTMKHYRKLPLLQVDDLHGVIPYDCVPVAVELVERASPLTEYKHPERAFYVFGAEDATLGARVLSWCRDVVYIPTNGCLNLAACVNVVLYDRLCKANSPLCVLTHTGETKGGVA